MRNKFKCKANKAGYCDHWLRECVSWNNCNIGSNYDAPCPYCIASSPLNNEQCNDCIHKEWKQENYD